ncbi:MAG: gliding motility-associated C-terminal domain-containing protein [Chryseolinea sp.]
MSPKYRFLLAVLLTLFAICSQVVFGQTKEVHRDIIISNTKLGVELNYLQPEDCTAGSGSINISVTGGSGYYSFKWTGPAGFSATSQNISGLGSGNYTLEVKDDANCTLLKNFNVGSVCTSPCNITMAGIVTNATACNVANGKVILTVLGGSGSYKYTWYNELFNTVASTKDLVAAFGGTYYVEAVDLNNPTCSSFSVFTIDSPFKVNYTSTANTKCSLPFTGTALAVAIGGSGNYTYEWLYPDATTKVVAANLTGAAGGNYSFKVKDNTLNCVLNKSAYISNSASAKLDLASLVTPSTTCSPGNGGVDITISNGSGDFTFTWYNQSTYLFASGTEDLETAIPADYSVYVTDNISKCSLYQQFTILDQTASPTFTVSKIDNDNCSSPFNGRAIIVPSGSGGSFSASWFDGREIVSTSLTPNNLAPGSYGLTLKDNTSGCIASGDYTSDPIVIEDHSTSPLSVNIESIIQNSSCGLPNGEIKLSVTGENYSVSWTGPNGFSSALEDLTQLDSGQYSFTVTGFCNAAPIIVAQDVLVQPEEVVRLNLFDFISDPDNNLDPSSFQIVQRPASGASAQIEQNSDLLIRYQNVSFRGSDQLTIKACDLLQACSENVITLNIEDVVVHNAVAPNSEGENKFMRIFNLPRGNKVSIFNRWGDLIFKVDEYNNEVPSKRFEGISSDGKGLPSGTYFYTIEFQNGVKPLTGYLALKQS